MNRSKSTPTLSDEELEEAPEQVTCKKCNKSMPQNKLVAHIGRTKDCKIFYCGEYDSLKADARKKSYQKYNQKHSCNSNKAQVPLENGEPKTTVNGKP